MLLGLSDLWPLDVWGRKAAQAKGMLILIAMLRALPKDVEGTIEERVKKGEV